MPKLLEYEVTLSFLFEQLSTMEIEKFVESNMGSGCIEGELFCCSVSSSVKLLIYI